MSKINKISVLYEIQGNNNNLKNIELLNENLFNMLNKLQISQLVNI